MSRPTEEYQRIIQIFQESSEGQRAFSDSLSFRSPKTDRPLKGAIHTEKLNDEQTDRALLTPNAYDSERASFIFIEEMPI